MHNVMNIAGLIGLALLWLRIETLWSRYMATKEEIAAAIREVKEQLKTATAASVAQLEKAKGEIMARIESLEEAVGGGDLAVIETAVAELRETATTELASLGAATQAVDDVVLDQPA